MIRLGTTCLLYLGCAAALLAQSAQNGAVFTKSIIGTLRADGSAVGKHEVIDPVGKRFTTGRNDTAVLVLSNGMGIYLQENSALVFESFDQQLPDPKLKSEYETENSRSDLTLSLESGRALFSQVEPWPTSTFTLTLPSGTLKGQVSQLNINLAAIPPELQLLEGTLYFTNRAGQKMTLQSGQQLDLDAARLSVSNQIASEISPSVQREIEDALTMTRRMRTMVLLSPARESTWEAVVLLTPEQIRTPGKDDHYIGR